MIPVIFKAAQIIVAVSMGGVLLIILAAGAILHLIDDDQENPI